MADADFIESPAERVLRERVDALEKELQALMVATGLFASDKDLDSNKGDPKINFDVRSWRGQSHKGRKMSEAEPEFLDDYAETLTWLANNPRDGKEKYAAGNRRDAARARSWARRLRNGWTPMPREAAESSVAFDDPFASTSKPAQQSSQSDFFDEPEAFEDVPF